MVLRTLLCAVMLTSCTPPARILVGNVVTLDPVRPRAEALAILGGRIVSIGSLVEVRRDLGARKAEILRLEGQTIMAGLGDAHGHLWSLGRFLTELDLSRARSYEELVRLSAERARKLPAGTWLVGRGWDQTRWPQGEFPHHGALSRAIPDRPVLLKRVDGHAALVNAFALAQAGIDRNRPDPPGGRILRDASGEPTGVLVDAALDLMPLPPSHADEVREAVRVAARTCAAAGLTQVHDMGVDATVLAALRELEARRELPLRVVVYLSARDEREVEALQIPQALRGPLAAGGRLLVRGVKLLLDGAMGSRGAALLEPYADEPQNRGLLLWPEDAFRRAIALVASRGLQPAVHAIGDRAVRLLLDAYREWPTILLPPRAEHLQLLPPEGGRLLRKTRFVASMQPTHATSDSRWVEARLGPDRARRAYAWRSVLSAGVPLAFGSDFPVEEVNPLWGVYAAETRQDRQGRPAGGWNHEERIGREEALRAFTLGVAVAAGLAPDLGQMAVGALADLSVFDRDPTRVPAPDLLRVRATRTFVGGEEALAP
jgi:predicted amidohydrolase YtcJ